MLLRIHRPSTSYGGTSFFFSAVRVGEEVSIDGSGGQTVRRARGVPRYATVTSAERQLSSGAGARRELRDHTHCRLMPPASEGLVLTAVLARRRHGPTVAERRCRQRTDRLVPNLVDVIRAAPSLPCVCVRSGCVRACVRSSVRGVRTRLPLDRRGHRNDNDNGYSDDVTSY